MMNRMCGLVVLTAFIGCNPPPPQPQPTVERISDAPLGVAQWRYVTKDGEGKALTEGLLTMPHPVPTGVQFIGSWQARYVGPDGQRDKIGPQINGGKLAGESNDGQLRLNLNPNMADNNVTLSGTVEDDRFIGTWQYSNFSGEANKGTFEALLSKE